MRECLLRPALLGVGLLMLAVGAPAPADAATVAQCQAMLDQARILSAGSVDARGEDCVFRDATLRLGPYQTWHAAQVTAGWIDLAALPPGQVPPDTRLAATGITFRPQMSNPLANYIAGLTARPFDMGLAVQVQGGAVRLDHFTMEGPAYGSLRVSGAVHGVDPRALARWHGQAQVSLDALDVVLDNRGLFEAFAGPVLASALLGDTPDPAARAEQLKAQASDAVKALLTRAGSSPDTVGAATRWIAALPHPTGRLVLHAAFPQPLTWSQVQSLAEDTPDPAALRALAAVEVSFSSP